MALPQTVDPSTLNLSGKPAIATAPTTTTSSGASNIQNPKIENVKNEVSPLLGGLFGGLLGYAAQNRGATTTGTGQTNTQTGTGQTGANTAGANIAQSILNAVKGTTGTSSGTPIGGGSTGTVNGMAFPPGTTQQDIDLQLGTTNGQSNYIIAGTNMSNGTVIAQPNTNIGGSILTGTGAGPSDTATPPTDQTPSTYFQDGSGNIYDPSGNLYAIKSGGDYYVNTGSDQWTDVNTGNVISTNDLYSYTGGGYDPTPVATDPTASGGYADNSSFNTAPVDTGTYVKDGGHIGGLPTPLFRHGGNVKHFATGGNSIIDAATAMAPSTALDASTPVATSAADTSTTPAVTDTSAGSIADLVTNLLSNKALTSAGLGALLTQLINSGTTHPTNMGVDMSALATLKPRTTPTGAAKFVPYSEYGTPTTPYDYSSLYQNLGVSPFGGGAVSPSTPTSAAPTPTTGGLSTVTPSTTTPTTTTPTTPSTPMYYSDADGNIYDANGDLVYDTTSSSVVTPTTSSTASSSLAVPSVATTPTVTSPSYSYGTPVNPSDVLSSKKGGLAKMADGGSSDLAVTSLYDATANENPASTNYALPAKILSEADFVSSGTADANPGMTYDDYVKRMSMPEIDPGYQVDTNNFNFGLDSLEPPVAVPSDLSSAYNDFPIRTMADTPLPYDRVTPTNAPSAPLPYDRVTTTNAPIAPQPFSDSPTFRFSGANNPLLRGLSSTPTQPYTINGQGQAVSGYALGGQPITDNLNVPVSNKPFTNVPSIQGRGDYRTGAYVEGAGDGQSDDIPAMLADGEYVIDAETVAQLGNGSNKAGAKILDQFRQNIRAHKRSAPHDKIPPKSKSALAYLKGAK